MSNTQVLLLDELLSQSGHKLRIEEIRKLKSETLKLHQG